MFIGVIVAFVAAALTPQRYLRCEKHLAVLNPRSALALALRLSIPAGETLGRA